MAYMYPKDDYDPYDPEQRKKRAVLTPDDDDQDVASVMAPDTEEGDQEENPTSPASQPANAPTLSPAQQKYKQVLSQMPNASDYQPSRGRRVLAAIAGGFAGAANPALGQQVAQGMVSAPFQRANSNWQRSIMAAQGEAGIEKEAAAQDIARQRATAFTQNSQARMKAAQATENFRLYQQQHTPWSPTSKEEYLQVHPPTPHGYVPQTKQDYMDVHPVRPTFDPVATENARHTNRMQEQSAHDNRVAALRRELQKSAKMGAPATPAQQAQAEHLAAEQLVRANPEYSSFYDPGGTKDVSSGFLAGPHYVKTTPRIKGIDDLPKAGGSVTPTQESLAREKYRQFLSDLDREKKRILGSKSSNTPEWDIQPEEDEEDQ